ncbi:hypothetical protein BS50DRAFT_651147 [Corynespora cassiicola Philippines]|uniref:Uncharacterized protein n=1 Tax=Corynespora cassiicola Philippines TaxID=1448308 RepID=A0A2T2N8G1_CORCC|nr:hypothetical protein BS50DRAFT_651147 [Corynespora cassiicola Philippines]
MCQHNSTRHNGCGHMGESHTHPYTLCPHALEKLSTLRGPNTAPLYSQAPSAPNTLKRSNTSTSQKPSFFRRFTSMPARSNTTASAPPPPSTRRPRHSRSASTPGGAQPRASTSAQRPAGPVTDHELKVVLCRGEALEERTVVSSEMQVCKECQYWIEQMRELVTQYKKSGSVKGFMAFREFLEGSGGRGRERRG